MIGMDQHELIQMAQRANTFLTPCIRPVNPSPAI
jgi:hypothetical protein